MVRLLQCHSVLTAFLPFEAGKLSCQGLRCIPSPMTFQIFHGVNASGPIYNLNCFF